MKKKLSKILIAVMIAVMVIPTVNYSFAETASQQGTGIESQEPDKVTTGSDAVTPEDGTEEEPTDSSQKSEKEAVSSSEVSEEPSTGDLTKGSGEAVAENVTEEMKFLYIDNRELAAPGTQNIAVSWDSSLNEIEEMQLIYEGPSGEELSLKEANRTDSSVLFTRDFKASEQGTYTIKGVKYFIDDEEYYFEFDNVEIDATFAVTAPEESEENVVDVEVNENGTINKKEISNDIDAALTTASISAPLKASRSAKSGNVVVVLDPGHGGGDPGAVANGLYEKNLTLKIAQYCKAELEQYSGIEVYMTRDRDSDVGGSTATQELQNRVNVGKKYGADLLISIHINAGGGTGAEVYYPNNNYNSSIGSQGGSAATKIQAELTALGLYNRGTKIRNAVNDKYPNGSAADYYGIIRMSKLAGFPGLIVEHAFIDNKNDAAFLKSEANLKKLGVADATGIAKYFGLSKGKWETTAGGKKYKYANGKYAIGYVNIGGKYYYFDKNGYMQVGHQMINGKPYQFYVGEGYGYSAGWINYSTGEKAYCLGGGELAVGILNIGGKNYEFDENGFLLEGVGWVTDEKGIKYIYKNGKCVKGYAKIDGKYYYFDKDGYMQGGHQMIGGKPYQFYTKEGYGYGKGWINYSTGERAYCEGNGKLKTGYTKIDGKYYYFDKDGYMQGGHQMIGGKPYQFYTKEGYGYGKGWINYSTGERAYCEGNGKLKTGYTKIDGKYYYFNKDGYMQGGHQMIGGKPYQFYTKEGYGYGKGWINYSTGERAYCEGNGKLKTGYVKVDGKYYYFDEDGCMQVGHQMIAGRPYQFYVKEGYGYGKGWINYSTGEKAYCFGDGRLAIGTLVLNYLDNIKYTFDDNGFLINQTADLYKISGETSLTADELVEYFERSGKDFPEYYEKKAGVSLKEFCQIYIEEAKAEDIKVEVAFCQAMKETGWLQFGGDVTINQFNFAGLGATGGGASGVTFKDVRTGIRAHIQHLKAYANDEPLNNKLVDPRFGYVERGCAPYVEWLGQKENPEGKGWATAKGYGQSIVSMIEKLLAI